MKTIKMKKKENTMTSRDQVPGKEGNRVDGDGSTRGAVYLYKENRGINHKVILLKGCTRQTEVTVRRFEIIENGHTRVLFCFVKREKDVCGTCAPVHLDLTLKG